MTARRPALIVGGAAALLLLASLALFWPGLAMYDSVAQYGQALSGDYDDWHPPIMARLWSLFGAHGAAPMLVLQLAGYWLGLGLIAAALRGSGRELAGWAVLLIGLWPPLLGWQAVVLKDTQMLGALLAATGLVAWWRLTGRAMPPSAVGAVAVLLGYAVLVRANAVFAVVPLAVALAPRPRFPVAKMIVAALAMTATLVLLTPINQRLLGAEPSGVQRTQALYDLAGIAVRTDDQATGLSREAITTIRVKRCVRPFFWDPLGEPSRCNDDLAALRAAPPAQLYLAMAAAALHHPIAYAQHRLAHLNSTERWIVAWHWPGAAPPLHDEPNDYGLRGPGEAAREWQSLAAALVESPLGWPVCWTVIAIGGLVQSARGRSPEARLAAALLVSALSLEASFTVLSIASDLRYHLWAMTATALALVLLGRAGWSRALVAGVVIALAVVLVGGCAARLILPVAPQTYSGMLG